MSKRILFYTEPGFERDNPNVKNGWVQDWVPRLSRTLQQAFGDEYEGHLITNTHLVKLVPDDSHLNVIAAQQSDLYDLLGHDPLQDRIAALGDKQHAKAAKQYGETIKSLCGSLKPDAIISLSPAAHLRKAFKGVPLLHHEYGPFSRAPMPETWYFDPAGTTGFAWPNHFGNRILKDITPEDVRAADVITDHYIKQVERLNPYMDLIDEAKGRFSQLALLPLPFLRHAYHEGFTPIHSQLQLCIAVLERVGPEVGVFITSHGGGAAMDQAGIDYIKTEYPNAIWVDSDPILSGPSQYFAPHVSQIITVSSTVGALKLIWGNALIVLNDRYMSAYADATPAAASWPHRDAMGLDRRLEHLAWFYKHLALEADLQDPNWMGPVMTTTLKSGGRHHPVPMLYSADDQIERWTSAITSQTASMMAQKFMAVVNSDDRKLSAAMQPYVREHVYAITDLFLQHQTLFMLAIYTLHHCGEPQQAIADFDEMMRHAEQHANPAFAHLYWHAEFNKLYALKCMGKQAELRKKAKAFLEAKHKTFGPPFDEVRDRLHAELLTPA